MEEEKLATLPPLDNAEDEDNDDLEETVIERLVGLTEMLPNSVRSAMFWGGDKLISGTSQLWSMSKVVLWVVASSATILALPAMFERERSAMVEQQTEQNRQLLLGPSVAAAGSNKVRV